MWLDLASHLGMAIDEVKAKHTSTQFLDWQAWLENRWQVREPIHYYLAQIALEIRMSVPRKKRTRMSLNDMLLNFELKQETEPDIKTDEELITRNSMASKMAWGARLQQSIS